MQAQAVISDSDVVLQNGLIAEGSVDVASDYPAEYLAFKRLQKAVFGQNYQHQQGKTDKEIIDEVLCEKYATLENSLLKSIKDKNVN
jgi:hypothetical protein